MPMMPMPAMGKGMPMMPMPSKGKHKMMMMMMSSKGKGKQTVLVNQVDLGNIRPEGITEGPGTLMYTSELLYGGVKSVDVVTGEVKQVVESFGFLERNAVGLTFAEDVIWVAGGGAAFGIPAALYVYDPHTGADIAACVVPEAGFLNDLIPYEGTLYVTDSITPNLWLFDVHSALEGNCVYESMSLPDDFAGSPFRANGLVEYEGGLVIANSAGGQLWYLDLETHEYTLLIEVPLADGLLLDGDILYSVENSLNNVGVFKLDYSKKYGVTAERIGDISSDRFRVPATVAMYEDTLFLVNARFDIGLPAVGEEDLSTFTEDFDVVAIPAYMH
jgi:hypothetical protein